jgi:hypothetical protein
MARSIASVLVLVTALAVLCATPAGKINATVAQQDSDSVCCDAGRSEDCRPCGEKCKCKGRCEGSGCPECKKSDTPVSPCSQCCRE